MSISLNGSHNQVHAADTASNVTTTQATTSPQSSDKQTVNLKVDVPTVDVTVKVNNPNLYAFPTESSAGSSAKVEQSDYKVGDKVKVQYSLSLTDSNTQENTNAYFVDTKEIDGKTYARFILADDVTPSATVPTQAEFSAIMKDKIAAAKKEYEENAKKESEKQLADLKKRFLYYTAKRKVTKKAQYYYTGYGKTTISKKNKKTTTVLFKKNKYKFKAKSIKIDQARKVGKTTYYHVKDKSANFWVKASDIKDLKPVFRKK